ncbi:CHAT domain-containing protein [Leptolyngbya sp. Heron Island J]|nr:CHAT domain-containing protein [Leptolyngbya sp. Heron Island J]
MYGDLATLQTSKAEILQQAQLRLLYSEEYSHPFFWAPFVLVGNWL